MMVLATVFPVGALEENKNILYGVRTLSSCWMHAIATHLKILSLSGFNTGF